MVWRLHGSKTGTHRPFQVNWPRARACAHQLWLYFLPNVILLVLFSLLFALPFKSQARTVARTVVVGAVISYAFWLLFFAMHGTPREASFIAEFLAQFRMPWWDWPALAAPPTAFALAYVAAPRLLPSAAEA